MERRSFFRNVAAAVAGYVMGRKKEEEVKVVKVVDMGVMKIEIRVNNEGEREGTGSIPVETTEGTEEDMDDRQLRSGWVVTKVTKKQVR